MSNKFEFEFTDFLDPNFQELVLALSVNKKEFLSRSRGMVKSGYFSSAVYKRICESLYTYWDEYRDVPNEDSLCILISKTADDKVTREAYIDKVKELYAYSEDDINQNLLETELVEFCQRAEAAAAVGESYTDLRGFDITSLENKIKRSPVIT